MKCTRILAVVITMLAVTALPSAAQGRGKGKVDKPAAAARPPARSSNAVTAEEARIIREHLAAQNLKPKPLPPGIAKNLARGKPLPPGIEQTRFPDALVAKLPPRPGYSWVLVGDRAVLLNKDGRIVDVRRLF